MRYLINFISRSINCFLMGVLLSLGIANIPLFSQSTVQRENSKLITFLDTSLITIVAPNGGEIWEPTTTEFIKWNSLNVTNLKIEFSTNNGSDWSILYSNISSIPDSINWVIPSTSSQQCLIRITDVNNNSIADTSHSVFTISSGGWSAQNSGISDYTYSIYFVNENLGFCVGFDGIILRTTNSGENWELMHYDPGVWLISVRFANENRGVTVGNNGVVLLTTDSGVSWEQINISPLNKYNSIFFADENIGWIAGDDGVIFKTTDGGDNWEYTSYHGNVDWYSLSFIDTSLGWIAGKNGSIGKTTDGGVSWVDQISNTTQSIYSVDIVDSSYGWAVGYNGTIRHTTDGGINWLEQQGGTTTWLQTVEFVNRDTGWIGGWYGKLLKTRNGGNFWSTQYIPTNSVIQSISFPNENSGWACDNGGGIFKYSSGINGITLTKPNGGELIKTSSIYAIDWISFGIDSVMIEFSPDEGISWEVITAGTSSHDPPFLWQVPNIISDQCLIKISDVDNPGISDISDNVFTIINWGWFPQPISTVNGLNCIYFTGQDSGWIAGDGGIIFSTINGGEIWQEQQSGTGQKLNSIFFINNLDGWIAGDNGTLIHTTNSGSSWSLVNAGTSMSLEAVYFLDSQFGWISGTNGTIMYTSDGGFNWSAITPPDNYTYYGIHFSTPTTGVVADGYGFINRTTNGGNLWMIVSASPLYPLYDMYFPDNQFGYAVGYYGTILRTSDSGESWTYLTEQNPITFTSTYFIHQSTGWTVGLNGVIWGTTNFGNDWYPYTSGTTKNLYSVFFPNPNIGWAAGAEGTLLKYFPQQTKNINIIQPNGGENLQNGSNYTITWISTDVDNVKIEYSIDNGVNWNLITPSVPASDQSYQWAVPNTPTSQGRIKITDVIDESVFDVSDTSFTISTDQYGWFVLPANIGHPLFSVHFENEMLGWAVGDNGVIIKTTDGGYTWTNHNTGSDDYLTTVEFVNNNIGWVVGEDDAGLDGLILKSTNGGTSWFSQQANVTNMIMSASFIDEYNGWVISYYGEIYHTSNGGTNWLQQVQLPSGQYYSIKFINSLTGWASGNSIPYNASVIYKTTNGGQTWNTVYSNLITSGVLSLSFPDENYGYGVGIWGIIMRTTNGGNSWAVITQGVNDYWLNSGQAIFPNLVWAVGSFGTILHTVDGINWFDQVSGTAESFKSIYMVNPWVGYIVSGGGHIYKTNSGGIIPINLINFSAIIENNAVILQWTTAIEINNSGFEILRSAQNDNDWNKIGFVPGYGTTSEKHSYNFNDENLESGQYFYQLKQIDYDGSSEFSGIIEVSCSLPNKYSLSQNYPNPFNPTTKIKFSLAKESHVNLSVFNVLGEKIKELKNEVMKPGYYEVELNASDLASGIYFFRINAGDYVETKKMILLK